MIEVGCSVERESVCVLLLMVEKIACDDGGRSSAVGGVLNKGLELSRAASEGRWELGRGQ